MTSSARRDLATGADAVVAALEELGVVIAFGQPGVHNLPIWTALSRSEIRMVGVRHEQTAAYAADALARTTGGIGVAITTTGPGAVNAASAIGEAFASRSPVVLIATNVPSTLRRPGVYRAALHETRDQAGVFAPITLATFEIEGPDEIYSKVVAAARLAIEAPSGPVYVEIPADLLATAAAGRSAREPSPDATRSPIENGDAEHAISAAAARLDAAERPLIWVGGGAARSRGARGPIQRLAERLGAPVLETYMGRGLIDREHPAYVGVPPHVPEAGGLWDAADAIVAIGSDLDGMTTQNWRMPSPQQLIAINVDPDDASKNYEPDVMLVGDAVELAGRLIDALPGPPRSDGLRARLDGLRASALGQVSAEEPQALDLLGTLAEGWPATAPIVCDMCVAGYWVAGFFPFVEPRRLVYPVGWGTLGFGFPAAIGAGLGGSAERVLCVTGDGGFMFACGELATAKQERAPVTILLVDDGGYGMLRFDFEAAGKAPLGVDLLVPEWEQLASSFGVPCERVGDVGESLAKALERHAALDGPSMIVAEVALSPPPTTSPRWYRAASSG